MITRHAQVERRPDSAPPITGRHIGDSMAHAATRQSPVTLSEHVSALSVVFTISAVV